MVCLFCKGIIIYRSVEIKYYKMFSLLFPILFKGAMFAYMSQSFTFVITLGWCCHCNWIVWLFIVVDFSSFRGTWCWSYFWFSFRWRSCWRFPVISSVTWFTFFNYFPWFFNVHWFIRRRRFTPFSCNRFGPCICITLFAVAAASNVIIWNVIIL